MEIIKYGRIEYLCFSPHNIRLTK